MTNQLMTHGVVIKVGGVKKDERVFYADNDADAAAKLEGLVKTMLIGAKAQGRADELIGMKVELHRVKHPFLSSKSPTSVFIKKPPRQH